MNDGQPPLVPSTATNTTVSTASIIGDLPPQQHRPSNESVPISITSFTPPVGVHDAAPQLLGTSPPLIGDTMLSPVLPPRPRAVSASGTVIGASSKGKPAIPQPPNTKIYVVQPKDTMPGIALKFGMPQGQLVSINRIHNSMIFPGQQLYVRADGDSLRQPPSAPAATITGSQDMRESHPLGQGSLGAAVISMVNSAAAEQRPVNPVLGHVHVQAIASPELVPVKGSSGILFNETAWYRSPMDGVMEGRMVVTAERFVYQSRRLNLSMPLKSLKECILLHNLRAEFGIEKNVQTSEIAPEILYKYFRLRVESTKNQRESGQEQSYKYYDFAVQASSYEKLFEGIMVHGGFDSMVSEIFMSNESQTDLGALIEDDTEMARQQQQQTGFLSLLSNFPTSLSALPSLIRDKTDTAVDLDGAPTGTVNIAADPTVSTGDGSQSLGDTFDSEGRPRRSSLLMRLGPAIISTLASATNFLPEESEETKRRKKSLSGEPPTPPAMQLEDEDEHDWENLNYDDLVAEHGTTESADVQSILSVDSRTAPSLNRNTELLTAHQIAKLASMLPGRLKVADWDLVYSTFVHGITLSTLYNKMLEKVGPSIMIVRDNNGYVFGAFTTEHWHSDFSYYGSGETFLFRLLPDFKMYRWTHQNNYFQFGQPEYIALGGGGTFALFLDHDLYRGSSSVCSTFNNEVLSSTPDFTCLGLEIWGFLP